MRWDDLELMRLIDQLEQGGTGNLHSGFALMEYAAQAKRHQLDYTNDPRPFAHELLVAREADLLKFDDRMHAGMAQADPVHNAHTWLQQIRDIELTFEGRRLARSEVFIAPLPNADEDDGRPINALTLEEMARRVGDTYNERQLSKFFKDSGVPAEFIPEEISGDKWEFALAILEEMEAHSSASRRALRLFIGQWLSGQLHTPPTDKVRRQVLAHLGQQGWHVVKGNLVIGERASVEPGLLTPLDRDARIAALHATIREVADRYLDSGHLEVAIFEAVKAVNNKVKALTGLDADGVDLMGKAFGGPTPPIKLADMSTDTGRNIQAGFQHLFTGAVRGIRNPNAHELFIPLNEEEAFEQLGLASMLLRRLDGVKSQTGGP